MFINNNENWEQNCVFQLKYKLKLLLERKFKGNWNFSLRTK